MPSEVQAPAFSLRRRRWSAMYSVITAFPYWAALTRLLSVSTRFQSSEKLNIPRLLQFHRKPIKVCLATIGHPAVTRPHDGRRHAISLCLKFTLHREPNLEDGRNAAAMTGKLSIASWTKDSFVISALCWMASRL